MKELIEKIYRLHSEHLVTPINLFANSKLKNYEYVKYYVEDEYFIAEMRFEVLKKKYTFYYYFDKNDMLQKICTKINKELFLVFSRNKELIKILEEYSSYKLEKKAQ
jgi:hypothetical protein